MTSILILSALGMTATLAGVLLYERVNEYRSRIKVRVPVRKSNNRKKQ